MADKQVQVERRISAPAELVWSMVADVTRMGEWSPETAAGEWLGGATGPVVGARFKGRNRKGARRWSTVATVTACDPGRSFVFEVAAGPMAVAEWGYLLESTADGCVVTETWNDQRGALIVFLGRLLTGVADRETHNRAGMATTLERLGAAAERDAATS